MLRETQSGEIPIRNFIPARSAGWESEATHRRRHRLAFIIAAIFAAMLLFTVSPLARLVW